MCETGKAPLNARGAVPKIKRGMVLLEEGQMVGAEQGTVGFTKVRKGKWMACYLLAHCCFSMTFH